MIKRMPFERLYELYLGEQFDCRMTNGGSSSGGVN